MVEESLLSLYQLEIMSNNIAKLKTQVDKEVEGTF